MKNEIKMRKAENRLSVEGYNNLEPKSKIEEMLHHYFTQHLGLGFKYADLEGKPYWKNETDTLVIAIDEEEVWRFGSKATMKFAVNLQKFIEAVNCDEVHFEQKGRYTIIRFWWD